ncbi:MAG: hypothetical protein IJC87_03940 [Clostridia bacterium]|nr:hypothetical protein [Clostridia bacterium]
MSFFTNNPTDRCPGRITGNPVNGLCERVCIQAQKVFDACIRQMQVDGINLPLENVTPANPTYPLTFVSARSTSTTGVITDLQVDRLPDRRRFARVQATVSVPVEVLYTDANGVAGTATSTMSFTQDIIMYVPEPSIVPFDVVAVVSVVAPDGVFVDGDTPSFTVSGCVTIIMKVIMTVELLVPSYGYAQIPQCQEYAQDVCSGFFDLPLYPNNT